MLKKKICMVGQFGVGKTSLVQRFVESMFDERYHTTLGVKIDRKDLILEGRALTLMLWDIAGEDDLAQFKISYMRGAAGYILVADGCRLSTVNKAMELKQRITDAFGSLPYVLALNKVDLREQWETRTLDGAFETSAKLGSGVEEMFAALGGMLLKDDEA